MTAPGERPAASDDPADSRSAPDTDAPSARPDARFPPSGIASDRDPAGIAIHRGWSPVGVGHRWMEPFVMMLLARGRTHGYAIVGELARLGITNAAVDVGQVYRTLRDLEQSGQVESSWSTSGSGPARREYELTGAGHSALDEWAAVMKERARLIAEFDAGYLEWLSTARRAVQGRR